MSDEIMVFVTCARSDSMKIAKPLVEEGLAACVNMLPNVTSVFKWQGKLSVEPEELLIIKSSRGLFDGLMQRVKQLHSYETPEIICVSIEDGYKPYLQWLNSSLKH